MVSSPPPRDTDFEPVFAAPHSRAANFSDFAHMMVAFFGGPLAIAWFGSMGARRIGTWDRDRSFWTLVWLGTTAHSLVAMELLARAAAEGDGEVRSIIRFASRAASVAWAIVITRRYRKQDAEARLAGLDTPSPWSAAIVSVLVGTGLAVILGSLLASVRDATAA